MGINGKVNGVYITRDNRDAVMKGLDQCEDVILTMIGIKVERYAKALCPVGTPESTGVKGYRGGTLRNSITFTLEDKTLTIGSNVEYAPYVELGTGPYFDPPPEWEHFDAPRGSGVGHGYVHPRPFLKPAIIDHLEEYKRIAESKLKNA